MAQYKLLNPTLRIVGQKYDEKGNPVGVINPNVKNAGNKYLYALLSNINCPWEGSQVYTSFLPNVVTVFEPLLPINKNGVAQQEQPIPQELQIIQGCYVMWKSPQPFYKKHLSAHPANPAKNMPAVNAGDIVKIDGQPVIYTELPVFCQYYIDEMGEKQWMRACTPEEVGRRAFQNYCVPVNDANAFKVETQPQQEVVGGQAVNTVNPQAQQQAHAFTQAQEAPQSTF